MICLQAELLKIMNDCAEADLPFQEVRNRFYNYFLEKKSVNGGCKK